MTMLRPLVTIIALIVFALFNRVVTAQAHHVYLRSPNSIPSYCQETNIWCGAAIGQMALEGYPGGVNHSHSQSDIWKKIQGYNNDPALNWATEPIGLQKTLIELGPPAGGTWSVFAKPDRDEIIWDITHWMTRRQYPTPILVYGFQHWVLITGLTTDQDPTQHNSVKLQFIEIIDPWNPPCTTAADGGVVSWMPAANWYTNYCYAPGNYPASVWHGKYVAVIEPPKAKGTVTVEAKKKPVREK